MSFAAPSYVEAKTYASQRKTHRSTRAKRPRGAPVASTAEYADLVIDAKSGRILHSIAATETRHPASLTKMMTLYLTFQALESGRLRLDQRLWVSSNAASQAPTKLGLRAGQSIRVEDAVLGLVTESANDASVVLAEALGDSEDHFAALMTRQARALGMSRTTFQNPNGLPDPDQVTCAADMVRLGYALMAHYPQYYGYFSTPSFVYAGRVRRNHNRLMERYEGMDGIKTGYIRASGFNLVASATRGRTRLIAAVFGGRSAASRDNKMEDILDTSFANVGAIRQASYNGDDGDSRLEVGEILRLPAKVNAVFAPQGGNYVSSVAHHYAPAPEPHRAPQPDDATDDAEEDEEEDQAQAAAPEPRPEPAAQPLRTPQVAPSAIPQPPRSMQQQVLRTPKTVVPRPTAANRDKWGIQIGAYTDEAVGRQALANIGKQMGRVLGEAQPSLQQVLINNTITYRARFMNLEEKTARSACGYLLKQRHNCLVVLPPR